MYEFDERDEEIRAERLRMWQARRVVPTVGDYVRFGCGTELRITRICAPYADCPSTGTGIQVVMMPWGASFYFAGPYLSYSGGLEEAFPASFLAYTSELKDGPVWFFHHDYSGAGRGVNTTIPCRVYTVDRPWNDTKNRKWKPQQ